MLLEKDKLHNYVKSLRRSKSQLNGFFDSDAEIINIGESKIAITTDIIVDAIVANI